MPFPRLFQNRPTEQRASEATSYNYKPLEDDCIRIVYLQPRKAKRRAEDIECNLAHVAFANKPVYNALSYAWGDDSIKRSILLDGVQFAVNDNLAAALVNIRGLESAREAPQAIWIDALCINQADLDERSRQVRHMPLIYARAQMVIVWLGCSLSFSDQCSWENNIKSQRAPKHSSKGVVPSTGHMISTVRRLSGRDYWQRLWIIQEIGKARTGGLRIHYDFTRITWELFIQIIGDTQSQDPSSLRSDIPLKLDSQREARFRGGHSLSNLLRTYQGALCKDPRDKIYGLLGLAVDVHIHDQFPIDYSKSLFQVYEDTIVFLNKDQSRDQHDILDMSRFVSMTLGGRMGLEPDGIARSFSAADISQGSHIRVLRVPGRLMGRIKEIGPMYRDVVAKTQRLNDWTSLIGRNISDLQQRFSILEQSEVFLEVLWRFDEVTQRTIFAFDRSITWEETQQYSLGAFEHHHGLSLPVVPVDSFENCCRLFLLQPGPLNGPPSWMGLAPSGTQAGDFVCQISGIERAVIIRQTPHKSPISGAQGTLFKYQIIGCAGLATDTMTAKDLIRGAQLLPSQLFSAGPYSPPSQLEYLNLYMDIHTAWELSSPTD